MARSWVAWIVALGVMGCAKVEGDDCERFMKKTSRILDGMAKQAGKTVSDVDRSKMVDECRKDLKAGKTDPMMGCVLKAKDDAGVDACFGDALADYTKRAKKTEAELQLNKLGKLAKLAYTESAQFPIAKLPLTPAKSCCPKCEPDVAQWTAWAPLDFQMLESHEFQYSYESDGKTFTATAVGDLDCDATMITYVLEGSAQNGSPQVKLITPPPNSD